MRLLLRAWATALALGTAVPCAAQGEAPADPYNQGVLAARAGQYEKAIAHFDEALRRQPAHAGAYYARGTAYQMLGQLERAIHDYTEAIRLDPKFADAYGNRGTAYENLGQLERAIRDYNEAIRLDPNDAVHYANRGRAYDKLDRFLEAIRDYEQALRLDPRNADVLDSLAWLLATAKDAKLRDGKRAVELALKANELTGYREASYVDTLAAAYARAGDFASAVKWQSKALQDKRFAANEDAHERLGLYREKRPFPPE
jgi:tetratricopeptide (TPR) repeat protein